MTISVAVIDMTTIRVLADCLRGRIVFIGR
jgi:hypothetical protein